MQVVIDPRIERDVDVLDYVRNANSYLERRLGEFHGQVEAKWSTPSDPHDQLDLTLRFTDEDPVEASGRIPTSALQPDRYPGPWLRRVVNHLFGRRVDLYLSRVREGLKELDREPAVSGA